jgi:hypothetical protein
VSIRMDDRTDGQIRMDDRTDGQILMDDRTDGQRDDETRRMDDGTDSGEASFIIPMSFNICN